MYVVPPHQPTVTLFHRGGSSWTFRNRREALRQLGFRFIRDEVGATFHACRPERGPLLFRQDGSPILDAPLCDYVLRDDTGRTLTVHSFYDLHYRNPCRRYWGKPFGHYGVQHPGRKRTTSHANWMRFPRTTAERRMLSLVLPEEGEPPVRARRQAANLPSAWDDFPRHVERNWKRHRATQYRGAPRRSHPRNGGGQ